MNNPNPINLMTSEQVRLSGWQAECRDKDGHLTRTHAPFDNDDDILWLVREALEHGETITIWPMKAKQ
jgi:molybdopterin synthase sulfur carrier subunit